MTHFAGALLLLTAEPRIDELAKAVGLDESVVGATLRLLATLSFPDFTCYHIL